ncbi:MAG: tetratricopeptide repeat protein [Acidobacteriia bacterium]|nr:tetratricopeptide repeat protein [Terriglobia bacterium]
MVRTGKLIFLVVLLAGYGAVYTAQRHIDGTIGEYHQTEDILFLPSGKAIKRLSLGFESLVADIYWIRAIQYYGGGRMNDPTRKFDLLYPLLDITTTLDPQMIPVYQFGAVFLSEPPPIGAGDSATAIRLLRKGLEANPGNVNLYLSLGFIYYWQLKDYKMAAEIFLEGAPYQRGNLYLKNLAAFTLARGGDRRTSMYLWRQIYETSDDKRAKENAVAHLLELQAENDIDELEKIATRFQHTTGRFPQGFSELVRAGYLRAVPVDPSGAPYLLDPQSGEVYVSASTQLPIPPP